MSILELSETIKTDLIINEQIHPRIISVMLMIVVMMA